MSPKEPATQAIRQLKALKADYILHHYKYEDHGGTKVAARELGVSEELVVKTLIFETEAKAPLVVLVPGHLELSTKNLARFLGVKSLAPASPPRAEQLTGYKVGGISPFGLKKDMPVYMAEQIMAGETLYINAGLRGFLVQLNPVRAQQFLKATVCPAIIAN